jgi:hypothetical protein
MSPPTPRRYFRFICDLAGVDLTGVNFVVANGAEINEVRARRTRR